MKTILDVESAWMEAMARFEKWRVKFEAEFGDPIAHGQEAVVMSMLPPAIQQALRQRMPEEFDRLVSKTKKEV